MEKEIEYYVTPDGKCPYTDWLESLDNSLQIRVLKRVDKLKDGIYGIVNHCKALNCRNLEWTLAKDIEFIIMI